MVHQKQTFNLSDLFEQRAKEIDAERRSARYGQTADPRPVTGKIWHDVMEEDGRPTYIVEMKDQELQRRITPESPEWPKIIAELLSPSTPMPVRREPEPRDSAVEALLAKAEEVAAVSGRIDPKDLIPGEEQGHIRQLVLGKLACECTIETHHENIQWLYSKDARTITLRGLIEDGRLMDVLDGPLPPTDRFGEMLRALLRQRDQLSLETLAHEDLINLIAAIEATDGIGLPRPDVAEVRSLLSRKEFLSEYDVLLLRGFFGRDEEVVQLHEFLSAPDNPVGWSSLVLTGPGGSGKSTLLAKFSREVVRRKRATVVILDFDRPGIDAKDLYWMEQEISRQVGDQLSSKSDEYLRRRRMEERRHRGVYVGAISQSSADVVQEERSSRSILWSVQEVLDREGAAERPVLLILDTYEQIEDEDLSFKIFNWLYEVSSALIAPLKVIFSGRLYDSNLERLQNHSATKVLKIDELAQKDAEELLLQNGVSPAIAARLAWSEVLPRRPLEMTLLARITNDLNKTVEELEEELREGGESAKELFAGLVYRRVLRRLGDQTAQQLAYPGLVLRYVTADLIRHVLAPALGLPPFDDVDAKSALEKLASCTWLVRRDNEKVWHRSDLRRSTLKAMIAAEPDSARKISEAAVKFFEQQPDDGSRSEAVYHRLLLMRDPEDGENFDLAELKKANYSIKADVADLPSHAATLLKFAVNGHVSAIEIECLPQRYLDKAYSAAGKELVANRLFGKALKLYERRHPDVLPVDYSTLEDWEAETLFATGSWGRLVFPTSYMSAGGNSVINNLARFVYPAQIISQEPVSNYRLETVLPSITENFDNLAPGLSGPEGHENLRKLVVSFIYAVAEGEVASELSMPAHAIFGFSEGFNAGSSTQPLPPVTQRRMMLLERSFTGSSDTSQVTFSINTLRLNSAWLSAFSDYFARPGAAWHRVQALASDMQGVLDDPPPPRTLRTILSFIDSLSKEEGVRRGSELTLPADMKADVAWTLLRGPSPEFRDPCRFALLDAFPNRSSLRKLGKIFASILRVNAQDLQPDAFVDTLAADPEHALLIYVEFVDRNWALGDLMNEARKQSESQKLNKVSDAFNRWNHALRATIKKGFVT